MAAYIQHYLMRPVATKDQYVATMVRCARAVIEDGGVVRNIRNTGVRSLPKRVRNRKVKGDFTSTARIITFEFVALPTALPKVQATIDQDEQVLRVTTLRADETMPDYLIGRPRRSKRAVLREAMTLRGLVHPSETVLRLATGGDGWWKQPLALLEKEGLSEPSLKSGKGSQGQGGLAPAAPTSYKIGTDSRTQFVVYPLRGEWVLEAVPMVDPRGFVGPEDWEPKGTVALSLWGLEGQALCEAAGLEGCVAVNELGTVARHLTCEGAVEMGMKGQDWLST